MKALVAALTLCCGLNLCADSIYHDDETGLTMNIPEGLKPSWNVSNPQLDFEITSFDTGIQDYNTPFCCIAITKLPLSYLTEAPKELFSGLLIDQMEQSCPFKSFYFDLDGVIIQSEVSPSLSNDPHALEYRTRMAVTIEDMEEKLFADIHFFQKDQTACAVITGICTDEEGSVESLKEFSGPVVNSIRFVE